MSFTFRCNPNDSALSRGRIPAHDIHLFKNAFHVQRDDDNNHVIMTQRRIREAGLPYEYCRCSESNGVPLLQRTLIQHFTSSDQVTCPIEPDLGCRMTQPLQELDNNTFYTLVVFWPVQFCDICSCFSVLPARIKTASHCRASWEEALFLLLLLWKHIATWDYTKWLMRRGQCWCVTMYKPIFALVARHYRRCVKVIDYRCVVPLLGD